MQTKVIHISKYRESEELSNFARLLGLIRNCKLEGKDANYNKNDRRPDGHRTASETDEGTERTDS